jgi:aminoglycoside phosphotransferase (APT) family kinase protein
MIDLPRSTELPGLDIPAVEQWILAHVDQLHPPVTFRSVGRGRSNLTYLVEDQDGGRAVLRRPPLGSPTEAAHDLSRERLTLAGMSAAGQPVPRIVAFCEDIAVTGAQFYVMEHVDGIVPDCAESVAGLSAVARAAVAPSLAQTLAGLHAADLERVGLNTGRGGDYGARQLRRWSRQWETTRTRDLQAVDDLAARLSATLPRQRGVTIVHGDYTVFNSVLGPDGTVRAVLDWELSTIGDPIADLAWCVMWWPDTAAQAAPGAEPVPLQPGFGNRADLIEAYRTASQRDVADLGWWRVLSYWKLAVILEGIVFRWLSDRANGGRDPGALVPGVERLLELADETAEEIGL